MASVLIHSGVNLLAPVYAIYLQEIDGTLLETGIAVGIYTILKGILCLAFAKIQLKTISHKNMMTIGYCIMASVYFLYPTSSQLYHVFILQAVLAVGESLITPSWSATIATSLSSGQERETYSKFYGYRSLFEGSAAIIGGFIAMQLGFTIIFCIMGSFAIISASLMRFITAESPAQSTPVN